MTYRGHDERQPQQPVFQAKSPEYMAAFERYSADASADNLARLMSFSKTQRVHCPRCNARMEDGQCWQGCFNEAAQESQRQVNAAICAQYDKPNLPPKPEKLCKIHTGEYSDFSHQCIKCATDAAIMARWEIRVGLRCETCGKLNRYCTCE